MYLHFTSPASVTNGLVVTSTDYGLRRYYIRACTGIVAPVLILAFFVTIWCVYLAPVDEDSAFIVAPPGGSYVYYAWFIVGVLGLNISLYSLNGVEAGILLGGGGGKVPEVLVTADRHASGTWSGPRGWAKALRQLVGAHATNTSKRLPSGLPPVLWFALAVPSVLVFIALPLSGLSLETEPGYVRQAWGLPDVGINVTGFTYTNFNERHQTDVWSGARTIWQNALGAEIPGIGIAYTKPEVLPLATSSLDSKDGLSGLFLTAQATTPIDGTAWGLVLEYNCSVVEELSELTLLKRRNTSEPYTGFRDMPPVFEENGEGDFQFAGFNETGGLGGRAMNMFAAVEFATSSWPNASVMSTLREEDPMLAGFAPDCYFNQRENVTGDYPGLGDETVLEMVLWQLLLTPTYTNPRPEYNLTLDTNLTELHGGYDYKQWPGNANISSPFTATGVRCVSSSSVGTAQVDGTRSTYTDFVRTDTPINKQKHRCAPRFEAQSIFSMLNVGSPSGATTGITTTWLDGLFKSVAAPPPFYGAYDSDEPMDANTGAMLQLGYLQASQLRQSLLNAHAAYATQLMYNGDRGFTTLQGSGKGSANPNVTTFRPGTVLKAGPIPVYVPGALLAVWALATVSLTLIFGFRRRWADTVDEGIRSIRIQ